MAAGGSGHRLDHFGSADRFFQSLYGFWFEEMIQNLIPDH